MRRSGMEERHRRAIQTNFGSLVEQTDLEALLPLLYEKAVFSEAMLEPYKDTSKDLRTRKRKLYRDIERRGPHAYQNLIDALTETGHWGLVRALDPNSVLHPHDRKQNDISLKKTREEERKGKLNPVVPQVPQPPPVQYSPIESIDDVPSHINVIKSNKFNEEANPNIECYVTRTRKRGIVLMITNIEFKDNIEQYRRGADVDTRNLKELFAQIGFHKILSYNNLPYLEMKTTIDNFSQLNELEYTECVFVIIASHGHARRDSSDTDIRCSDGGLMPSRYIIDQFNNDRCRKLRNIPKVFIFQTCRGNTDSRVSPSAQFLPLRQQAETDGATRLMQERLYSDIIIANSTLPGLESSRDPEKGSWYIQAVCAEFAEHAHDTHVDELFNFVDRRLHLDFNTQTSSVDRWGFFKRLYLHPGLFDDTAQV